MSGVTAAQIKQALRAVGGLGGQSWSLAELSIGANNALRQSGITTRQGAASFVAQCMVESAYFRTTREIGGSRARYAPYFGRGFIQVTWRENYAAFGKWLVGRGLTGDPDYFVDVPDRLAAEKWAWLGAVWYFTTHRHGLVSLANAGENVMVGRAINRGDAYSQYAAYGEDHRQAAYNALLRAGISAPTGALGTGGTGPDGFYEPSGTWSVEKIQEALGLKADGKYGEETKKVIAEWQEMIGLTADGLWGPKTEEVTVSIQEDLAKVAKDIKDIKTEQKKIPARVAATKVSTPKSVLDKFPSANAQYTLGGLMGYNLIDFYTEGRSEKSLEMLNEIEAAVTADGA